MGLIIKARNGATSGGGCFKCNASQLPPFKIRISRYAHVIILVLICCHSLTHRPTSS